MPTPGRINASIEPPRHVRQGAGYGTDCTEACRDSPPNCQYDVTYPDRCSAGRFGHRYLQTGDLQDGGVSAWIAACNGRRERVAVECGDGDVSFLLKHVIGCDDNACSPVNAAGGSPGASVDRDCGSSGGLHSGGEIV